MGNRRQPLPEDIQQVVDLVKTGQLFALQKWIEAGKRFRAPEIEDYRAQVLWLAVDTGFYSVVEELLRAGGWTPSELAEALDLALCRRRSDIADLLLNQGASLQELDFETVCRTMDLAFMERYLRAGGDPSRGSGFAGALSDMKARPLLRFYRQFRSEFPALDDQAALALCQAVDNEQVRWTALLAWAGADPFRPVPWSLENSFPVDPGDGTNAATKAVWRNKPEILKVLHLRPNPSQALELLDDAGYRGNVELFRTMLKAVPPDQINHTPRGSCTALERLVSRCADRGIWSNTPTDRGDAENLQCIELLLDMGARWNPPPDDFRHTRRSLMEHDGRYIVQILRLLLYTPGAADIESVLGLCDSKVLRAKIATVDPPLIQELKQLRKKKPVA